MKGFPLIFVILLAMLKNACTQEEEEECDCANKPPNIIFILTSDQGYDDVGYHNDFVKTPNIERLREEGITLEQSYTQPAGSQLV